ncbi:MULTISPECIES: DUF998 domain-containing protein [unclassified Microbacterium]|uniref:DUF998 domain-containing protein n=1 Tax=unclassified Microbacterium TaxID=2609290 RepID=UPI000CFD215E|nr:MULTISPECIES: DUF998 domain-containing protein [unclassified Microbacterium]PQZ53313.1 hypothetical protein CQ032_15395 [Microbacterium sp. MYb43]PQZ75001.1 hypothetical protein CQ031_14745 [Microbacterium sp. MYb40]PRB19325.1 hypothetical protein CQ040_16045 [Microbacterium sp. MYb54]PRB24526.1 hypothetical protein CQ037_16550 [Microbacterium sp. MYb50]PRB63371.1 hypothetical protein CQ021_16155 [Microbacterium sp. MYb24]
MSSTSPSPDLLTAARSHGATRERAREAIGLQISIFAFVLAGLVALVVFRLHSAPISGPDSLGQFAAIASAVTAIVVFVLGRVIAADPARHKRLGVLDIIDIAAFAFAHAMIALLGWTLAATIIEAGLIGAVVFPLPVLMLAGAAAGLTAYVTYYSATHLDLQLLATVLAVFLVLGILASMLTASDPQWWKENLSALGMTDDISARAFNLTLIVAGILVTTLARYATKAIPTTHPRGVSSVRTCLIIVGIFLGMVGVFPVDEHFALHTGVASGMVVAYAVLVIAVRWWVPGVSRTFLLLGYVFTLLIVVLSVFFAVGYYTLTAVELVAGTVVFTWIILFIRTADALKRDAGAGAVE